MINTRLKPVTTGLIGAVGLGVALLGMPEMAKALDGPLAGTDYLITPDTGNTYYNFPFGRVEFRGVPTFRSGSDTVAERLNDCVFDLTGMCEVEYIIRELELKSRNPIEILPNSGFFYDVFVNLDDSVVQTSGTMTLGMDGSYSSTNWPVAWKATFVALNNGPDIPMVTGTTLFDSTGRWAGSNGSFYFVGLIFHEAPDHVHEVISVPEPSTVLGLIAVGLSSIVGFKGKKEPK